jgi:hypothetical protein
VHRLVSSSLEDCSASGSVIERLRTWWGECSPCRHLVGSSIRVCTKCHLHSDASLTLTLPSRRKRPRWLSLCSSYSVRFVSSLMSVVTSPLPILMSPLPANGIHTIQQQDRDYAWSRNLSFKAHRNLKQIIRTLENLGGLSESETKGKLGVFKISKNDVSQSIQLSCYFAAKNADQEYSPTMTQDPTTSIERTGRDAAWWPWLAYTAHTWFFLWKDRAILCRPCMVHAVECSPEIPQAFFY